MYDLSDDVSRVRMTGLDVVVAGLADLALWCAGRVSAILSREFGNPPLWIALTTVNAVVVATLCRSRRAIASRGLVGLSTTTALLGMFGTLVALGNDPSDVRWSDGVILWFVLVGALVISPWLQRFNLALELSLWAARPQPPEHPLPAMPYLSRGVRELALGARVVRASFNGVDGFDREARQLVWDFLQRVDGCSADDQALLGELGLHADPMKEVVLGDKSDGVQPLLRLDAALLRFESELAAYRSHAYR